MSISRRHLHLQLHQSVVQHQSCHCNGVECRNHHQLTIGYHSKNQQPNEQQSIIETWQQSTIKETTAR